VDKKGAPLVMYHATTADFDAFDTDKKALMGKGSWFSFKPYEQYVKSDVGYKENANIIPAYLSLKNIIKGMSAIRKTISFFKPTVA
jgi:hypothetical protein